MNDLIPKLRICVCTSCPAHAEPRAPRHAALLASLRDDWEIVFIDGAPAGERRRPVKVFENCTNLVWQTHYFAHRRINPARLIVHRLWRAACRWLFRATNSAWPAAISSSIIGFERRLAEAKADVYLGHNIEALIPVCRVARRRRALAMFDSMEFHSDMGDSQSALDRAIIRGAEAKWLPDCALVLASSDQVADELVKEYGIKRPLPLYNVPPLTAELPSEKANGFHLYWRNAVVGLGQRGLEDALVALSSLPVEITLHVQGRLPLDGGAELRRKIAELGLTERVKLHPPYAPEDAVTEAARHTVGLCLERKGSRNHDLTVSNKLFDYQMAGLAVVASNLPGLRGVMDRSRGGLLFQAGSAEDLAGQLLRLYRDPVMLRQLSANARAFALREGNREFELQKFRNAFLQTCAASFAKRDLAPPEASRARISA